MTKQCSASEVALLSVLLLALAGLYLFLLKPDVAGFLYDDGMYLMAARALAEGQGYRLIGIAGQPFFYKYPPLYPLLLAEIWRVNPHFPDNILWLKLPGILLSLASLSLLFYYARTIARLSIPVSLGLIALMGLNWRFIEVATEMMSEPLWMALSLLTLILAERGLRADSPQVERSKAMLACLIVLSVLAFYTRTVGLVLIAALLVWMLRMGLRKTALIYGAGCGLLIAPWLFWSASRPDTTGGIGDFLIRSFQETYFQSMRMDLRYEYSLPEMLGKGIQEWLGNLSVQFFPLLERFFLGKPTLLSESLILALSFTLAILIATGIRQSKWDLESKHLFLSGPTGVYVALYLLILSCWSFYKFYPRFMVVILPFLWIALIQSIRLCFAPPVRQAVVAGVIALGLLTEGTHIAPYLARKEPNRLLLNASWDLWPDYTEAFAFIRKHTPPNAVLYSDSGDESYFYALNTGRPTLDFFLFLPKARLPKDCDNPACLQPVFQARSEALLKILSEAKARYLVINDVAVMKNQYNSGIFHRREQSPTMTAIQSHPETFRPVFHSSHGVIQIYARSDVK